MHAKSRFTFRLPAAVVGLVIGLIVGKMPDLIGQPTWALEATPRVVTLLSSGQTVTGETIAYPDQKPAQITAVVLTLQPGEETGFHSHAVPTFGYILDGEVTVDYGDKGRKTYRQGEAVLEAMTVAHNGRNSGAVPMRILAVFMGADGIKPTEAVAK
jgi:quercetin dioxygenase-like cupin family protein